MAGWRVLTVVSEGSPVVIGGRDVWTVKWRDTGQQVELDHPSYPGQSHSFRVFTAGPLWPSARFAAAELSANVWGFYVPR